ncbi:leucyl aminopeptidase [Serratia sp. OS31]|uniref:leucyl aminopeptidase n=1 Tax=Serratia sp. OS31 TaxID=2760844 RepID=UPI002106776C|nr:leucyl aminopeptidase [Serratia sp. OS31]
MYSSSTKKNQQATVPDFIPPLKSTMTKHWKKSVLFKDYGQHFTEAFAEHPDNIEKRNNYLIKILSSAEKVIFEDVWGNRLLGDLNKNHTWTSISGKGNIDIIPGEIASHVRNLNGHVTFGGTFLSTIPFAIKYGVTKKLVFLKIQNGKIVHFESENEDFSRDFKIYLNNNEGNAVVEEYGIGTNRGIQKLYGRNAGFEERHPGLHLGLGGGKKGSHHLDMIFSSGKIFADDTLIFDNGYNDRELAKLSEML